jgi:hypothetical protein
LHIVLAQLLGAGRGASRGVGFLARFLVAWPASTMGTRKYRDGDLEAPDLAAFDQRIEHLLDRPLPAQGDDLALSPTVLHLSAAARKTWIEYHDEVEAEIGRVGELAAIPDFAAKSAENAARIAAVFHAFTHGPQGEISRETMQGAAALAYWHLSEARRIIGATSQPAEIVDAQLLEEWLIAQGGTAKMSAILQVGPNRLRKRTQRDAAVKMLCEKHRATEAKEPGGTVLRVNPKVMEAAHV